MAEVTRTASQIYATRLRSFLLLYFLQGLPYGIQTRFLPVQLRKVGMTLTNLGYFRMILAPWVLKGLWAPIIDSYGDLRPFLNGSHVVLVVLSLLAAQITPEYITILGVTMFLIHMAVAIQDIALDGLLIEMLTPSQLVAGNMVQVIGYKLGSIVSGGFFGFFTEIAGWDTLFYWVAFMYLIGYVISAFGIPADNVDTDDDNTDHVSTDNVSTRHFSTDHVNTRHFSTDDINIRHFSTDHVSIRHSIDHFITRRVSTGHVNTDHVRTELPLNPSVSSIVGFDDTNSIPIEFTLGQGSISPRHSIYRLIGIEGTAWLLPFVLVYKFGDQGVSTLFPMFMIDAGLDVAHVAFWSGCAGQVFSLAGSVMGGFLRKTMIESIQILLVAQALCLLILWATVIFWNNSEIYYASLVVLMLGNLASGGVTTCTFTLIMQLSQTVPRNYRTSHYTLLATSEVAGRLIAGTISGILTDTTSYSFSFGLLSIASVFILPSLLFVPDALMIES